MSWESTALYYQILNREVSGRLGGLHSAPLHLIIFEELCRGHVLPSSRQTLQDMCSRLCAQGAQGIVLGCTELPLILSEEDLPVPIFDTTRLHALAAVEFALA